MFEYTVPVFDTVWSFQAFHPEKVDQVFFCGQKVVDHFLLVYRLTLEADSGLAVTRRAWTFGTMENRNPPGICQFLLIQCMPKSRFFIDTQICLSVVQKTRLKTG